MFDKILSKFGLEKIDKGSIDRGNKEKSTRITGIGQEFTYAVASSLLGAQGIPQPKRMQTYQQYVNLYGASVWVYACVYQIASSIAGVPLVLYKKPTSKKGKLERIDDLDHPINKLISKPNPYMSEFELKESLMINLELIGNSYIEEVKVANTVVELWPLQSKNIRIIPGTNPEQFIRGYVYEAMGRRAWFDEEDMTHIKYANPESDFYGSSPLTSAEISTSGDIEASRWNRNFFKNSARPDSVLESEQFLNDNVIKRLKAQWAAKYGGTSKSHKIAVLEGGLKYKQVTMSTKDMDFIQLRKFSREEILAAYGVHGALLGIVERVNNSIMDNIRRNFWENTLMPKMVKIQNSLNRNLVEPFDEKLMLKFDIDSVDALKESRETRSKIAGVLTDRGIMTINEVRQQFFNLDPVDWGKTWYMPLNLTPVDKIGQGQDPINPIGRQPVGKRFPSIVDEEEIKLLGYSEFYGDQLLKQIDNPYPVIDITDTKAKDKRREQFTEVHEDFEDEFVDTLVKLFESQAKKVVAATKKGKKLKDLNRIIDSDKNKFRAAAETYYSKVIESSGGAAMEELLERIKQRLKE